MLMRLFTVASHNRGNILTLVKPGIMTPPALAPQSILVGLRGDSALTDTLKGKIAVNKPPSDKPTAKRQVVNNSARTALIAGTAGSKFQPGRCAGSKENKMGDGLSK